MRAHGYFWCDHCEELASGQRCEHCSAVAPTVRWIQVPSHQNPFRRPDAPKLVSQDRARELFAGVHAAVKRS